MSVWSARGLFRCHHPSFRAPVVLRSADWHKFKRLLASKTFAVHDTKRIRGEDLTAAWAEEGGFREPVIAPNKTGMGLKVQPDGPGVPVVVVL